MRSGNRKRRFMEDEEDQEVVHVENIHPLGIQPLGNDPDMGGKRLDKLGILGKCTDQEIIGILGLLRYKDLCSVMRVNKSCYGMANFEELWRFIVFDNFEGMFKYQYSWKYTFMANLALDKAGEYKPPIRFDRVVFSDYLFQPWMCASMKIPNEWIKFENVDRRAGLTKEQFVQEYESKNLPVIITDAVSNWKAYKNWNVEYLNQMCGDFTFACQSVDMKLSDYFQYCAQQMDERPLYLFDTDVISKGNPLENDFESPLIFEDIFSVLGDQRPDHQWLIVGPKRSGSTFHKDPNATSAWNAVITGAKKWVMYPPNQQPPGVFVSEDEADVITPVSIMEWFLNWYESPDPDTARKSGIKECVVHPGEMIFVPSRWWHTVLNLEDSIALTHNFVSQSNFHAVLDFLKNRPSQISGVNSCRNLYDEFISALKEKMPQLAQEAERKERNDIEKKIQAEQRQKNIRDLWNNRQEMFKFEF
jgi:hypothetical protein